MRLWAPHSSAGRWEMKETTRERRKSVAMVSTFVIVVALLSPVDYVYRNMATEIVHYNSSSTHKLLLLQFLSFEICQTAFVLLLDYSV